MQIALFSDFFHSEIFPIYAKIFVNCKVFFPSPIGGAACSRFHRAKILPGIYGPDYKKILLPSHFGRQEDLSAC